MTRAESIVSATTRGDAVRQRRIAFIEPGET
jgi:hypothetical protein